LKSVLGWAVDRGWIVRGLIRSPIEGPAGNMEFLAWLARPATGTTHIDIASAIDRVVSQ